MTHKNKYIYIGEDLILPYFGSEIILEHNSIQNISWFYCYFARCARKKVLSDKHPERKYNKCIGSDNPEDLLRTEDLYLVTPEETELYYDNASLGSIMQQSYFEGSTMKISLFNINDCNNQLYYNGWHDKPLVENWFENNFIPFATYREEQINEILND